MLMTPDTSQQQVSQVTTYASLAIAALAVIVGPFVQRAVAKQQLLGPMRQAWIDDLRKRISEFIAVSERLVFVPQFVEDKYSAYIRISELLGEIELALNPGEEEHNALIAELRKMSLFASNIAKAEREGTQKENQQALSIAKAEVMRLSKQVFKAEWERVKGWTRIRRLWRKHITKKKTF